MGAQAQQATTPEVSMEATPISPLDGDEAMPDAVDMEAADSQGDEEMAAPSQQGDEEAGAPAVDPELARLAEVWPSSPAYAVWVLGCMAVRRGLAQGSMHCC